MVGINVRNLNSLDKKYTCPICSLVLRDPIQLIQCGHRQCQSCLKEDRKSTVVCQICGTETLTSHVLLDRGFSQDMKSLLVACSLCEWSDKFSNYEGHLTTVHSNPTCKYCGEHLNSVEALYLHQVSTCQKYLVDCKLKAYGCDDPVVRVKMNEHYLTEKHQNVVIKLIRKLLPQINEDHLRITTAGDTNATTSQLQEVYEMIDILGGGIETLNQDQQRLSNESLQLQQVSAGLMEQILANKLSVEESNGFLAAVKQNLDILNQEVSSLKEKVGDSQFVSYDGTLLWKIERVKEKMMDAQTERQTSIYSPPFYSSVTGYKMRARLYLNGDGNARRTHMSLFFVLMRGLNDPILKYPFNYKVSFCLYDQTPAQRHIIDSFRPDIKSSSFQRPRSDMNIASGIPKFFPLDVIQQEGNPYVRDDTMFIKVMVDFGELPKTLVPYCMSLNPGLPAHVQHVMIKQEMERRSQEQSEEPSQVLAK